MMNEMGMPHLFSLRKWCLEVGRKYVMKWERVAYWLSFFWRMKWMRFEDIFI